MSQKKVMVYFNEEDARHKKTLDMMSAAGPKKASPALIEMAYAGAILADMGLLRIFIDGHDHSGPDKALDLLQVLGKGSAPSPQPSNSSQTAQVKTDTKTVAGTSSKPKPRDFGHFNAPSKIF